MIPKEIIEKAIEGKWMSRFLKENTWMLSTDARGEYVEFTDVDDSDSTTAEISIQEVVLDPLFWQSLFKEYVVGLPFKISESSWPQWRQQATRFFDLILTNGDTAQFWTDLIKK